MRGLYGAGLMDNNKRWKVEEVKEDYYHTYILKDTKECYSYELYRIIGFEQVDDKEFLIFKNRGANQFGISRYRLEKNEKIPTFDASISDYWFLNDDNILLTYITNSGTEHVKGVYSISSNDYVDKAKWLNMSKVDAYNTDIETQLLFSHTLSDDNEVIFGINTETFEPDDLCYSTLRDSCISIKSIEDIKKVMHEDEKYIDYIHNYNFAQERKAKEIAREKLLTKELDW